MNHKQGIFITGESGVIPLALQTILKNHSDFYCVNNQEIDVFNINKYKKHQSFIIRQPELDFTNHDLLFSSQLEDLWKNTKIIIHSGAFVGTDYCLSQPSDSIKSNVQGTYNIVELAKKYNIKIVYFSTTAIFDPQDYSEYNPITENTKINPTTLYGITKYAGEQIVLKNIKNSLIVRPVFGFGNYPDDLHSALTKFIYTTYYNKVKDEKIKLSILLNRSISKNYTRVENIAQSVIRLIENDCWNEIVNVGDNYSSRINWEEMSEIIFKKLNIPAFDTNYRNIIFQDEKDYLHWHNIDNSHMTKLLKSNIDYISLNTGINMTIDSVIKNINITPYWI